MEEKEKKREICCPRCKEAIDRVINVDGTNRYYHYRGNKPPCTIRADLIRPYMEIIKKEKKAKHGLKEPQERRKEKEKTEELPSSRLPISDEMKKKGGIEELEILPHERRPYEILEEILRNYRANEKIIKLLVRKAARRDLSPDEVEYNLSKLGVRTSEAEWIADEYEDAIVEEERKGFETKKPRQRGREVIREEDERPYRGRYQESYKEAYPMREDKREESRSSYLYSNESAPLTYEDISKMIEEAVMKREKEEKLTNLSRSLKNLEMSLKEEIQKIRTEIPTESEIKEKVREVSGKEENRKGEYEKVLKQEIDDLAEDREKVKEETREKRDELKEDFKDKEKELKEDFKGKEKALKAKIDSLETDIKNKQRQASSYKDNTWRYKSDITEKVVGGATAMTREILDRAPFRKGLNIWVRGGEEEREEERERIGYIEPKSKPLGLPEEYISES